MIDSLAFHDWPAITALSPDMTAGFREWAERPSDPFGAIRLRGVRLYNDTREFKGSDSDVDALIRRLDAGEMDRAVLGYDRAILATAFPAHYAARNVVRAANDWTIDQWLARDKRLFSLALVSTSLPDEAAAEIRRIGTNDRVVGVALGTNALGRPFGDPIYHPIYRAASELDLPIVIQVGSDEASELNSPPVAGGRPTTFAEVDALGAQSNMAHTASLILQGAFEAFPRLKILLVGGGAMWIPAFLWRLDFWYKMIPSDSPWLRRLPSDYFTEHFRVATYGLESLEAERLGKALDSFPALKSLLMYASGYPSPGSEEPTAIAARLPQQWHDDVFEHTAAKFYRWPGLKRSERPAPIAASRHNTTHSAEASGG